MFSNSRTTRIEWGDCDPAGIIFYPRYFAIFDVSTSMLIERALGMKKIDYLKAYAIHGHPVVETRAKFLLPTRFGDDVTIESAVVHCGRSSFKIEHRLTLAGALAVKAQRRGSGWRANPASRYASAPSLCRPIWSRALRMADDESCVFPARALMR